MNINIASIEEPDETSRIQDSWDSLVSKCSRNPFLFTDFAKSFICLNKANGWNPMIVTMSDERGLLAVVPLMVKRVYGIKFARFILSPWCSPDFVISSKHKNSYAPLAIDYIFNHTGCHIISLGFEGKPGDSRPLMNDFRELGIHHSFGSQNGHRVLPINSTWEEFERLKGSSFRHKFRKIEKNLGKLGAWNIAHLTGGEVGQEVLDKISEVERESWKETWRAEKGRQKYDTLAAVLDGLKRVTKTRSDLEWSVYFLEIEGSPIAYSLVICYAGVAYITKTSYKAQYRRFYPGIYINHAAIRNLWKMRTFTLIDFLTDLQFMRTWTETVVERCVFMMSKNPFLPPVIELYRSFLNDKIEKRMGTLFKRAIEILPTLPT